MTYKEPHFTREQAIGLNKALSTGIGSTKKKKQTKKTAVTKKK